MQKDTFLNYFLGKNGKPWCVFPPTQLSSFSLAVNLLAIFPSCLFTMSTATQWILLLLFGTWVVLAFYSEEEEKERGAASSEQVWDSPISPNALGS